MKTKIIFLIVIISFLSVNVIAQMKNVTIDQKLSTGVRVGTLKKWNTNVWSAPFNPGTIFSFSINSNQVILGDQAVYTGQKYNNWNSDLNNIKNHRSFLISNETDELKSNFIATHTSVIIKTSLEGTSATGGVIEFRDPWFIDYQEFD